MEYIQAVLFTFKYIFGQTGNTDLFYLFSAVALMFYLWRRHDKLAFILKATIPFAIVCMGMVFLCPNIDRMRVWVFLGKMLLNITLMLFVAYNSRKWKLTKFVKAVVWILAAETGLAFMLPNSSMWITERFMGGAESVTRLRLFYLNAGALSFACGFILILLVYQLITEEVVWHQVIGVLIIGFDIYLSYGMSGMACAVMAVAAMLLLAYIYKFNGIKLKEKKKFVIACSLSFVAVVGIIISNSIYVGRTKSVLAGTDYILVTKLLHPLRMMGKVLSKTNFLGVGFGNANTSYALDIMDAGIAYPNSFLRIIAEGGVFGILLVLTIVIGLGYTAFKYGSIVDKSLCIYVLIYQFVGGYFTDPTNFLIYGLIIGSCIKNKIEQTGSIGIKLFMPKKPQRLLLAELGHKHLFLREGGVEIVVEEISKRLVAKGHKVDAYDRGGNHISGAEFNKKIEENYGINIITIPTIQKKGFAALIYSFIASIVASAKEYDVIHYHAEGPCAFIWIPSLLGIRTVATIHGLDWQRTGKWGSLASQFIKFGERMAVEYADEIIVLSKQVQNYFLTTYNRKTNFIPNGIDRPELLPAKNITEKWGLKPQKYILCLARLTHEKGFHYAVEAFRKINTDMKLVIAGGSSDSDSYVEMLKQLVGDDERIVFTGFVRGDDLAELYSNAYVYCLPSDLEGMPISLLEAMSYGNCCLVSDISECTSVIGKYGRSFAQGDVDDLRKEMEELINHPEDVAAYKSKSADYVCNKYKWDDVVDKTIVLYKGEQLNAR